MIRPDIGDYADMHQLDETRGPDCIDEDVRSVIATLVIGGLVVAIFLFCLVAS